MNKVHKPLSRKIPVFLFALVFISSLLIFAGGLGYTGMSNRIPWALWIVGDLVLIALGGMSILALELVLLLIPVIFFNFKKYRNKFPVIVGGQASFDYR